MGSLRRGALVALTVISLLTCGLGAVGWLALTQTRHTVVEFESVTLPDMSVALGLSEGVAQLAALAPYVAESALPFQLQSERKRLERRFAELYQLAQTMKERPVRRELLGRMNLLEEDLTELVSLIEEKLFIREDTLTLRFELETFSDDPEVASVLADDTGKAVPWILTLNLLADMVGPPDAAFLPYLTWPDLEGLPASLAAKLQPLIVQVRQTQERKVIIQNRLAYLLAAIRAQSEQLTGQVNQFVELSRQRVANQRALVADTVHQGHLWIVLISAIGFAGLLWVFWVIYHALRDLQLVTDDMRRLAAGDTGAVRIGIHRHDEIGVLAKTYEVFRHDALKVMRYSRDLREKQELLETVFHHINDGLSVFNKKLQLVAWNERYLEIFGLRPSQVRAGMSLSSLHELMLACPYTDSTLENQPIDVRGYDRLRRYRALKFERSYKDGKVVEFRSQPMPGGSFVTLYSDLTERKQIESQLRQAQKMEVLGQLTGGMAHDFNNLLAAILGNLQMLCQTSGLESRQVRYVDRAMSTAERGASLVERLLAFSRKQQLHPEPVLVDELIEGMLDLVEYSVSSLVSVSASLNCPAVRVLVDPSQLENALLNLALNSSAAMEQGGTLIFKTEMADPGAGSAAGVIITVSDTGSGIPEAILERVLEPFFTTKAVGRGSGLGLSMVYGFVRQSGGELTIDSQVGEGTRIALSLPLAQAAATPPARHPLAALPAPVSLPRGARVLIVEDDLEVCLASREQLETLGLQVASSSSAEEALTLLEADNGQIRFVLSDVNLKGVMSGIELYRAIGQRWPAIRVLLTSGLSAEMLRQQYAPDGLPPFLPKPYGLSQLSTILRIAS